MKKTVALMAFGLFIWAKMTAQVSPPDFNCVRGDTLFWNLPVNNCGPFVSYEVWASQSPMGPFVLQATITNPAQDYYAFINPSGEQWFFYLLSKFNCPGQASIPSDTLDNRPPEVSPIQAISVENGQAVVTWYPSPSPEVVSYVIYRQTSIGVVPVDTIYSGNTYTDPNADPQSGPESYFVNALDPCGNTSIFDVKHTSVFVEAEVIPCNQSVKLSWNPYVGWTNPIAKQEIWAGANGGPLTLFGDAGGSASSFEAADLLDETNYCFEVRSVEAVTGVVAKSNQICLFVDVVHPPLGMLLDNVSVNANNEVVLSWQWDPLAELTQYQILSSSQNTGYQPIATQATTPPLSSNNSFTDTPSGAAAAKVFYQIETRDVCDSVRISNYGSTIFLTATNQPGNINQLKWTMFDLENGDVSSYALHKVSGGTDSEIGAATPTTNTFDDEYDPNDLNDAQACYYVVAKTQVMTETGELLSRESRSNTACVEQDARIFVPNAFVPEGVNYEFKPLIALGDISKYEMKVYDRYGQEVFSTDEPSQGWDGSKNGKPLAQGVYAYVLTLKQSNGKVQVKSGHVTLIR
ncbi:MAG: gliding motility-associated C-terminal domain-containing protein [Saprospiraceae bacterium]|nr:gliding motility-associated C-terminal domain-containing protein [Saprospiraceae bacterium]